MGRLIDTDNLLFLLNSAKEIREKLHRNTYYLDTMIEAINNEPTAYDPDKVVEQLEDYGIDNVFDNQGLLEGGHDGE